MRIQRLYNCQAINGSLMPTGDVSAMVIVFLLNGTWMTSATYEEPQPLPDVGKYDLDEDTGAVTLWQGEASFAAGILNADALILNAGGYTFVATRGSAL